jgi:hypothetical protein
MADVESTTILAAIPDKKLGRSKKTLPKNDADEAKEEMPVAAESGRKSTRTRKEPEVKHLS